MNLTEILSSSSAWGAAITAVCATIYKGFRILLDFHDEYWRKRHFKFLSYLLSESNNNPDISVFVASLKKERLFAAAFGHPAAPRLATALMSLHSTQLFSLAQLRSLFHYVETSDDGSVKIEVGIVGWAIVGLVIAFVISGGVFTVLLISQLATLGSPAALLTAAGVAAFFLTVGIVMCCDAIEVVVAHRAAGRLASFLAGKITLPPTVLPKLKITVVQEATDHEAVTCVISSTT